MEKREPTGKFRDDGHDMERILRSKLNRAKREKRLGERGVRTSAGMDRSDERCLMFRVVRSS